MLKVNIVRIYFIGPITYTVTLILLDKQNVYLNEATISQPLGALLFTHSPKG